MPPPQVMNGAILQQGFVVEYVVDNHMCLDCTRANTNANTWTACVQVRATHAYVSTAWSCAATLCVLILINKIIPRPASRPCIRPGNTPPPTHTRPTFLNTQVRQHVPHKRTFLFLEQLILKHNADAQVRALPFVLYRLCCFNYCRVLR